MAVRHRAVLFDLFDTLCRIDESLYLHGKESEARLLGLPLGEFLQAWVAAGDLSQTGVLPDIAARVRHTVAALGAPPPDDETVLRVAGIEESTLLSATSLYPDVPPALAEVRALPGLKIGLVSNASSTAALLFERLGLRPWFDFVLFSFQAGVMKPSAAIYLKASAALGVSPAECLFVGDGNGAELDGAKAVGMEAVRIERPVSLGPYRKRDSVHFDASVPRLTEVVALIRT